MKPQLARPDDSDRRLAALLQGNRGRGYHRIVNAAGGQADVYLYDEIGMWGTTARDFADELNALNATDITLHLNSPGGDAWDGQAIYHALRDHPASIGVRVEGLAASAASTIAMAADPGRLVMAPHSMMMIHDPWGVTMGDARDHMKSAEMLNKLGDAIAGFYADRAGRIPHGSQSETVAAWRNRMLAETWYGDQEAVDAGLADRIEAAPTAPVAADLFDLSAFLNTPQHLLRPAARGADRPVTKREAEQALRDAGLPAGAAKAILAGGWDGLDGEPRDEVAALLAKLNELNRGAAA